MNTSKFFKFNFDYNVHSFFDDVSKVLNENSEIKSSITSQNYKIINNHQSIKTVKTNESNNLLGNFVEKQAFATRKKCLNPMIKRILESDSSEETEYKAKKKFKNTVENFSGIKSSNIRQKQKSSQEFEKNFKLNADQPKLQSGHKYPELQKLFVQEFNEGNLEFWEDTESK